MANLKKIWIEEVEGEKPAIRMDWDNDRHQRIEIKGSNPLHVISALNGAALMLEEELDKEKI